jgi:D-alanyl-D-alanine carboxypeptidase
MRERKKNFFPFQIKKIISFFSFRKRNKKIKIKFDLFKDNIIFYLGSTFLILFTFIFILRYYQSLNQNNKKSVLSYQIDYKKNPINDKLFVLKPVLKEGVYSFPVLSAQSVIALDLDSGVSLYEKKPDLSLLPASITKLITAMVALESFDKNAVFTFGGKYIDGQKMGLVKGEGVKVIDLINAILVYSANDAAYLLAENYPGGVSNFVSAMNEKVRDLGALNTNFENPTGFDGGNHKTTARDLVVIAKAAIENPDIREIVKKKDIIIESSDRKFRHYLTNTNKLLGEVDGVMGVKTGWTENARENLITYYERNDHRILIILLGSQDRFGETKDIINWINSSYDWLWVEVK